MIRLKSELLELLKFTELNTNFKNNDDVRYMTIHGIFDQIQNFYISIIFSQQLNNIDFLKNEINDSFVQEDINDLIFNYEGFIKDAFYIKIFILVENHINQIAEFYQKKEHDIKDKRLSIINTFENLTNPEKCSFFKDMNESEKELFNFYCYLRNTIHKVGIQSKSSKKIIIKDDNSVISKSETKLELFKDKKNELNCMTLLLLIEQILKMLLKINSKIPKDDFIKHNLVNDF